jgi:hypothetical protein
MTGGNSEAVPDRKGKRKNEEKTADEAKKVKLTSEQPASSSGRPYSSAASPSPSSQAQDNMKEKKKSLLGQLLTEKVDAGRGFGLFD